MIAQVRFLFPSTQPLGANQLIVYQARTISQAPPIQTQGHVLLLFTLCASSRLCLLSEPAVSLLSPSSDRLVPQLHLQAWCEGLDSDSDYFIDPRKGNSLSAQSVHVHDKGSDVEEGRQTETLHISHAHRSEPVYPTETRPHSPSARSRSETSSRVGAVENEQSGMITSRYSSALKRPRCLVTDPAGDWLS